MLDKIALFNSKPLFSEFAESHKELLCDELLIGEQLVEAAKYNYLDLFRYKSLRSASVGFMGVSFAIHIIFYGR